MSVQSVLLVAADIRDDEIFVDFEETRAILQFFWPAQVGDINGLSDSLEFRRFALQTLIAGVDGSYALGYVHATFGSLGGSPPKSILSVLRKLAMKSASHWYKHAKGKDLRNPKIYLRIRDVVASSRRPKLQEFKEGIAIKDGQRARFFAHIHKTSHWG